MTEDKAREHGFTVPAFSESSLYSFELLIKPTADLDGEFTAFDRDTGEILNIRGWLFTTELEEA